MIRSSPTLGEQLEQRRLAVHARRLEQLLGALRLRQDVEAKDGQGSGPGRALERGIERYEDELEAVRTRLAELAEPPPEISPSAGRRSARASGATSRPRLQARSR